ncbi:hypothetical protein FOZ63_004860, partial [Perkinsus olseni]
EIASNLIGKGRDTGVDHLTGSEKDRLTLLERVKSRDTTGIKCYRCLKPGHSASTCLATEPADMEKRCIRCGSPSHTLDRCSVKVEKAICRRCKFPGHLAYTCRTNVKAGLNEAGTPTARGRIAPNAKVHMIGRIRREGDKNGESIEEVENYRVASTNTGHVAMAIGEVILEGKPVSALFDTGAEVSLVTISTLKECVPMATVECRHVPKVSVAGGAVMKILGMVQLTVAIGSNAVTEWFTVTEDTMTVPVLLGCSTLARLNTKITPEGVGVDMSRAIEGEWVSTIEKFSDGEGEQPSDYDSINDDEDEFKDTLPKIEGQDLDLRPGTQNLPVDRSESKYLSIQLLSPDDKLVAARHLRYPFGLRSSPLWWGRVSGALVRIFNWLTKAYRR